MESRKSINTRSHYEAMAEEEFIGKVIIGDEDYEKKQEHGELQSPLFAWPRYS